MDVTKVFNPVDLQPVRFVYKNRLPVLLQEGHDQFLTAVPRVPGHIHVLPPDFEKQALQEAGLAPSLPDTHIRAATLDVIPVRRYALPSPGLPVGKHEAREVAPGTYDFVHGVVESGHSPSLNDSFAHLVPP